MFDTRNKQTSKQKQTNKQTRQNTAQNNNSEHLRTYIYVHLLTYFPLILTQLINSGS